MRKIYLLFLICVFCSCSKIEHENLLSIRGKEKEIVSVNSGIMFFDSKETLSKVLASMEKEDITNVNDFPVTRSIQTAGFVSLSQDLNRRALSQLSASELIDVEQNGLVLDIEDSTLLSTKNGQD